MKRTFSALFALFLAFALAVPALAAEAQTRGPHASPAQRVAWGEEAQGSDANSAQQGGVSKADFAATSYPASVTRAEDGSEIRKIYELSPDEDPAGIPRSGFDQDGFHYTLTDLLRQEAPEYEERTHTETVTISSKSKDMASVLELLPQEREFVTDDGLSGILTLRLDTVNIEEAGRSSSTQTISATRTYPSLSDADLSLIPKTIEESGKTLALADVQWSESGGFFTASATYSGTATSSYVTGYTVTADYVGMVSHIALNKVRYAAIFEGTPLTRDEPEPIPVPETPAFQFHWAYVLAPLGALALIGGGIGLALFLRHRNENEEDA